MKCDWSDCFDKLENGEIDIMGDISYSDERAQKMLFSDEPMGEEKYILYADLSNMDIGMSDFKFMDGKRVGALMDTEPEIMLTEWENKNGIHTEHVNVNNDDDVEKKLANHEIDAFVSLEESIWSEQGISSVTTIGKSGIYFAINKERSDIKTELDYAMCQLDQDSPFFKADLYKKYFTLDYCQSLTGGEKSWLEEHDGIRIGFLSNDAAVFSLDEETGKLTGMLAEYFSYAKDCLGNQTLEFNIQEYDDYDEMLQALQEREIDMIFYAGRNPYFAEKNGYTLTNTAWTYSLMAVTDEEKFDENKVYTVAVPREKYALKQHIAFSYPQWKLIDCDSLDDAADMVIHEKADCFLMGASQALIYDNSQNFKSIPLTKTMEACFAVRSGEGTLLSILNKTLKAMPSDMLTSALAIYDSTADKVTFLDFVKDNMLAFFVTAGFFVLTIISIILVLLRKARKAEAAAKLAANDTQKLNEKLEIALKKAEDASLVKTSFLNNMSHDIRTPLTSLDGYFQLMETCEDQEEQRRYMKIIQERIGSLKEMLEELFTFTKLKNDSFHLEMSSCCINKILKDTIFSYYDEWTGRGIEPEIQITDKLLFMNGNEQGIQRIFQNIIKNGLDHGEKKISISLEEVENNIRIQIKNQVCHVEKINVDQVFERFYKADEARSKTSSGLGLSIAKELVLRMDGKISARIEGNEFCVEIVFPK